MLEMFQTDPARAMLMIGGSAATPRKKRVDTSKPTCQKPVAAFIAGQTAPPAAAWVTPAPSSLVARARPKDKIAALHDAGSAVAATPNRLGNTLKSVLRPSPAPSRIWEPLHLPSLIPFPSARRCARQAVLPRQRRWSPTGSKSDSCRQARAAPSGKIGRFWQGHNGTSRHASAPTPADAKTAPHRFSTS